MTRSVGRTAAPDLSRRIPHPRRLTLSLHSAALITLAPGIALAQSQASPQAQTQDATTQDQSVTRLPALRVQGTLEDERHTPGSVQIIKGEELERANSMADVIRYQPLVTAPGSVSGSTRNQSRYDRAGTTGYNIRGIEGNRIGLDVDGIEMPDAVDRANTSGSGRAAVGTFGMGRDFIDPDTYSSVEILSGTTNARRSAGGIGGAVSFRTKSAEDYVTPEKPLHIGGRVSYNHSDRSWLKGLTAAGMSDNGLTGLINYSRRDGKQTRNNSDSLESYPAKWHSDALLLKGGLQLNPNHKLELSADIYRRKNESMFDNWNSTVTAIASISEQDSKTERDTLAMTHTWTPASSVVDVLETRLYYQHTNMDDLTLTTPIGSTEVETDRSRNKTDTWGFTTSGSKRLDNHHLRFGLNASTTEVSHPLQVNPIRFGNMSMVPAAQPYPDTRTLRLGAFIEDEISFEVGGKRLAVIPGLRVDRISPKMINADSFDNDRMPQDTLNKRYDSVSSTTILSPSLGLVYDLTPRLSAYAQWKYSGRAPNVNEIFGYWNGGGGSYAVIGNPDLNKETSHAFDLGLKGSPTRGLTLNGSVFYTQYSDFIAYTRYTRANNPEMFTNIHSSLSTLYQADNRDAAQIYGAEISARLDFGHWYPSLTGLHSTVAVGYSKGRAKSYYEGDGYVDLDSVQPAKGVIGVGYEASGKQWGVDLISTFVKGKQAQSTTRNSYSNDPSATISPSTVDHIRVPGYARFDLLGYWQLSKHVRLDAGIYNLTDREYWDYSSARGLETGNAADQRNRQLMSNPGRSFSLGLAIQY
ncbi:MAG: TonB-dependent hemoglobin/transferrin/lactoferrin family receptor [Candidimonas sp.]